MGILRNIFGLFIFCFPAIASFSQTNDSKPQITGQTPSPLTTQENTPITITLDNLIVSDADPLPVYPDGFSLELNSGDDYEFSGATVTPDPGFSGTLTVRVRVNDGKNNSSWFNLEVEVIAAPNVAPQITGQTPITINQGQSTTLTLSQLTVTDPDDNYPTGFALTVYAGSNYTFSGTTVTPASNFTGALKVPVSVNDGEDESNVFELTIDVVDPPNVAPQITGQSPISINQGQSVTITLAQLTVTDPDDNYPTGFTLTVRNGANYTVAGSTVTPLATFFGDLKVQVSVNDGEAESNIFELTINVLELVNVVPIITGQTSLAIDQGESLTITLAQLTVVDPDDTYPGDFTLTVYSGTNYTFAGTTITPSATFSGTLTIPVSVNDGKDESARFDLKVQVNKPENVEPKITGQVALSINQGQSLTIAFSHLVVTDPDNTYPTGFTLTVYAGGNYTVVGNTITPAANFSGNLKVPVSVNDGQTESKKFDLKIEVLKVQPVAPQITGQKPLTTKEEQAITINLSDLTVVDPDNTYPQGFTLKISPGPNYSAAGSTITPAKDYSGQLTVAVRVNDGKNDSAPFDLQIMVAPVNDPPVITGQKKLTTDQGISLAIALSDLNVTDPDNTFPDGFTLNIKPGANYVAGGGTISPTPAFSGKLTVVVSVNDGTANSPDFNLEVTVVSTKKNVAPQIVGQKAISITQNTAVTLQLSQLVVEDPDNEYPIGFNIKVSPGANYTVNGTTITPASNFVSGTLSVGVRVNDGTDDSNLYQVKIQVTPISATPRINGQRELTMMEDSTITVTLADLIVTDADNPDYPTGFTLKILSDSEGVYTVNGTSVTPAPDLNGFIDVGVTVSDGVNTSEEFRLAILVTPVNDAPRITQLDTSPVAYEPGKEPAELFRRLVLQDVDNEYLSMAEVGFRPSNFSARNDELLFDFDTTKIRVIHDPNGILFLIGYATVDEYQTALRSMRYNYQITHNTNGEQEEILTGSRIVYVNVNDGQSVSLNSERTINLEAKVMMDIPSAFTPNGDNANDTWHLQVSDKNRLDQAIVKVYNKRGLLLYEAEGFEKD
ncbi:MAG TPA: tandem-95 repeat protein, partial [Chryseolinea sp.]